MPRRWPQRDRGRTIRALPTAHPAGKTPYPWRWRNRDAARYDRHRFRADLAGSVGDAVVDVGAGRLADKRASATAQPLDLELSSVDVAVGEPACVSCLPASRRGCRPPARPPALAGDGRFQPPFLLVLGGRLPGGASVASDI
jgi:hypothetical protein